MLRGNTIGIEQTVATMLAMEPVTMEMKEYIVSSSISGVKQRWGCSRTLSPPCNFTGMLYVILLFTSLGALSQFALSPCLWRFMTAVYTQWYGGSIIYMRLVSSPLYNDVIGRDAAIPNRLINTHTQDGCSVSPNIHNSTSAWELSGGASILQEAAPGWRRQREVEATFHIQEEIGFTRFLVCPINRSYICLIHQSQIERFPSGPSEFHLNSPSNSYPPSLTWLI